MWIIMCGYVKKKMSKEMDSDLLVLVLKWEGTDTAFTVPSGNRMKSIS